MRSSKLSKWLVVGAVVSGSAAHAQEMTLGEFEYLNSCVACHGVSGNGDGPVTDFLSGATVPDLTVLQSNNGGVFPVTVVYETIDGAEIASAHGTRDMPIWGNRFRERVEDGGEPHFSSSNAQGYANTRILALIEYLASIQIK